MAPMPKCLVLFFSAGWLLSGSCYSDSLRAGLLRRHTDGRGEVALLVPACLGNNITFVMLPVLSRIEGQVTPLLKVGVSVYVCIYRHPCCAQVPQALVADPPLNTWIFVP